MKSSMKKRVLAVVLCMVLMLSTGISTMADGEVAAGTPVPESGASQEPAAVSVEGEAVEGEQTPAEEPTDPETSTETQEETPTEPSAAESKDEPAADTNNVSGVTELVGGNVIQDEPSEQETESDSTEQEPEIVSEATELKQEFKDETGNVTQRVTANIPEGAFQANASEVTMEVNYLDEAAENHVKELMTAALPENEILGDYILYDIKFKVNGEVTEPQKAITITFEGSGLHIEDTTKANTFYIDPADPAVQDDKDEIVEITQKSEMIENLQNAGQSIEDIDEYDLSEISVKEDGTADKILMEGRISTVYGCYVEKTPVQVLEYTDDDVTINVNAYTEDAIPTGASLKVVPLRSDKKETEEQYKEVEKQLNKKAENEEYDIAGFLAYDISFINENGEEVEPNGDVKVTMDYKRDAIPEGVKEASDLDVTVMHLEENKSGEVKDVVDMNEENNVEALETTDNKVQKVEFVTKSFSVYTITWKRYNNDSYPLTINMHYVDTEGKGINGKDGEKKEVSNKGDIDLTTSDYQMDISDYEYQYTTIDRYNNSTRVTEINRYNNSLNMKYNKYYNWPGSGSNTYNVYFVYKKTSSGGGGTGSGTTLGTPDHNKYIKSNGNDSYTLSLDVTGKQTQEVDPIDIMIVLDYSGSMKASLGGADGTPVDQNSSRIAKTRNALISLYDQLADVSQTTDIRFSVVSFGKHATLETGWTSYNSFGQLFGANKTFSLNSMYSACGDGTNWQSGILLANEQMNDADPTARKYFLFVTDGLPTYRYSDGGAAVDGHIDNNKTSGNVYGTGSSDEQQSHVGDNLNAAAAQYNASSNLKSAYAKYVVDVASSSTKKDAACYSLASTMGAAGTAYRENNQTKVSKELRTPGFLQGTTDTQLTTAFETIAANIKETEYTNVYIEDELSEYVDFADEPNAKVYTVTKNGSEEVETEMSADAYSIAIDEENKKIRVDLLGGAALEKDVTYRVKYDISVEASAKQAYINNGYSYGDTTGDADTDAWDNVPATSSGQPGFHSNKQAVVGYKENGGEPKTADYKHPVVQIDTGDIVKPDPNPLNGSITKTMGEVNDGKYPITLNVKARQETTSENADVDVVLVIDLSNSMTNNETTRLEDTKTAAKAFVKNFIGESGTTNEKRRVAIVTFHNYATRALEFTGDVDSINSIIDGLKTPTQINPKDTTNGGTNTEDGFKMAKAVADDAVRTENEYVIFLTDGVPTYRNKDSGDGYTSDSSGTVTSYKEYVAAVEAGGELTKSVKGIYTIGLLNGYNADSADMDVARRLLASSHSELTNYKSCYYPKYAYKDYNDITNGTTNNNRWDTSKDYSYSAGYFEITSTDQSASKLEEIWTELASIIQNNTSGLTGDGWTVTDKMADNVTFQNLHDAEMNGHKLTLSDNGKTLTTTLEDGKDFTVATFDSKTNTITWHLKEELAVKSEKFDNGYNYDYNLIYYVNFEDTGSTEFRKTNDDTYVDVGVDGKKLYPPKMPFFINVIGTKVISGTTNTLSGAKFKIYRDEAKTDLIAEVTADDSGKFQFQVGQTDLSLSSEESASAEAYTGTIYLEETEAPYGYQKDNKLHAVMINVTDVTYQAAASGGIQEGTPSGTVALSYTREDESDLLSLSNDNLILNYSNVAVPDWGIIKRSASNPNNYLEGAEFGLYKKNDSGVDKNPSYTGKSDAKGLINVWKDAANENAEIRSQFIPAGTYILKETKAPNAYQLSDEEWTITIAGNGDVTIKDKSGTTISKIENLPEIEGIDKNGVYFYFDNTILYELPSTGGPGIFLYMVGGVLLMMAAALILYKNKHREVLEN